MTQTFDVDVARELAAPVKRVWAAWTEPDDLREWWGPAGFTCPYAAADVREGGQIVVVMRAPDEWGGFEQRSSWTITSVEPPHRLAYVFRFLDADDRVITPSEAGIPIEGVPDSGDHEITLEDLGDGRTRLRVVEHGYLTPEARDMSRGGLEQCLDKLAALVEGAA